MFNALENKVSFSTPPHFSKLQLKDLKFASPQKQVFTAFNPENEEDILINIYQASCSDINYEATVNHNELLVALAFKQKSPQHILQITGLKCIEKNSPTHEYNSTLYYIATYKYREVIPLLEALVEPVSEWNEQAFLSFLFDLICSLSEVEKVFSFQKAKWCLKPEAIYFDLNVRKFIIQVEPIIQSLKDNFQQNDLISFLNEQSIDPSANINSNLFRAILVLLDVFKLKISANKDLKNKTEILQELKEIYPILGSIISSIISNQVGLEEIQNRILEQFNQEQAAKLLKHTLSLTGKAKAAEKIQDLNFHFYGTYCLLNNVKKATDYFNEYFTSLISKKKNIEAVKALVEFAQTLYLQKKFSETQDKITKIENFYNELGLRDQNIAYYLNYLKFLIEKQNSNNKMAMTYLNNCHAIVIKEPSILSKTAKLDLHNKRIKLQQSLQNTYDTSQDKSFQLQGDEKMKDDYDSVLYVLLLAESLKLRKDFSESVRYYSKGMKFSNKMYNSEISLFHAIIYTNLGDISKLHGDYDNAFLQYKKTLEIKEHLYEPNHPELIMCQEKIGLLHNEMGEFKKALEGFRRTLQMKKITYSDQSIETATTLNMIGTVYRSLNQFELSLENYKKCYEVFSKAYGERHLAVATILNNLGAISNKLKENDKALKYYEKSYDIFQAHFDDDHPIIATCLNNIGTLYQSLHDHKNAVEKFQNAIRIHRKNHGENNENMASLHYSLGVSYENLNDFEKAEEHLLQALEIAKNLSKEESLDAIRIYKALGSLYKNKKNIDSAYNYYNLTLELQKKLLNPDSHEIANTYNLLGTLIYSAGIYDEAINYYENALKIFEKDEDSHKNIDRGYLLNNMASVYKGLNNNEKSLELYLKAMETFRNTYGRNHPTIGIILNNMGAIYRLEGRNEEAIENYKQALEILNDAYGKYHPTVATIYNNIGTLYTYLGQPEEALNYLNKALKLSRVVIGENHAGIAALYFSIGKLYLNFEDFNKAQSHLQKALELYQKIYPEGIHSIFPKIFYGLGEAHRNLNQMPISQDLHEKAIAIQQKLQEIDDEFEAALSYYALGLIANHNDDSTKSIDNFNLAMSFWETKYGFSSVQVSQCCYQIGSILRSLKDYDYALSHLTRAFEILDKSELYGDFLMANVRSELGIVYQSLGEYPKALENHRHALEIRKKKSLDMNYDLVCSLNNVGLCYNLTGQYNKALDYTKKAYDGMIFVYGETHSFVIGALINLGGITDKLGKYNEAIEYFNQALEIRSKNQNEEDDLETAKIHNNLGGSYFHLGDYHKAEEYYQRSFELRRQEHGEDHPEVATSYNNLGLVADKLRNYTKALEYHKASLKIRIAVHGEKHPALAISYNNIGLTLQNMENYEEGLVNYKKAGEILDNIYKASKHPMMATILNNIAIIYKHLGNFEESLKYHEKALEIQKQSFSDKHPEVATTLNNIGELYYQIGNFKKSLEKHLHALDIRRLIYRDLDHPEIAASLNNCGSAYKALGEFGKALENYEESLVTIKKLYGTESPDILILYLNLSSLHEKMGNHEKAEEFSNIYSNVRTKSKIDYKIKEDIFAGV